MHLRLLSDRQALMGLWILTTERNWESAWQSHDPSLFPVISLAWVGSSAELHSKCVEIFCCPLKSQVMISSHCTTQEVWWSNTFGILCLEISFTKAAYRCSGFAWVTVSAGWCRRGHRLSLRGNKTPPIGTEAEISKSKRDRATTQGCINQTAKVTVSRMEHQENSPR